MTATARPGPAGVSTNDIESRPEVHSMVAEPFPPIEDYAFLSDCHTGALIAGDGSIEWLCVPSFDAPSIFSSLLDREAGSFRLGPYGIDHPTARQYRPGTNVLESTYRSPSGWVKVHDALTIGARSPDDLITPHVRPPTDEDADHVLLRVIECLDGHVEIELTCAPVFDYGKTPATWAMVGDDRHIVDARGAEPADPVQLVRLRTDLAVGIEGHQIRARRQLTAGDKVYCALSWGEHLDAPGSVEAAIARIDDTTRYWRRWLANARIPDHRWSYELQRSALTIKGLTYAPTGAAVAALTTSLPETPGGQRNWDYRFTWMRDATFTLQALHWLNLDWEAEEFMQFLEDLQPDQDGALQIMYGIDGRRVLTESRIDWLSGYQGSQPVRIGNAAFDQKQNDVFGAVLDSILLHSRRSERLPRGLWPLVESQADCASQVWREPDQGIWEARGKPRHYVSSKLMSWVALDRAATLADIRADPDRAKRWRATADEIRSDILSNGVSERGVLRQHYETDALDASTLLAGIFGFLSKDDQRLHNTVKAINEELTEDGYVLRYRTDATDDGMSGKEGTFLICSFWLASSLAQIGDVDQARRLMERLLHVASPLGLYAEELDPKTGHHLGNFPQAFSHLAMIEAAGRIIVMERLAELI